MLKSDTFRFKLPSELMYGRLENSIFGSATSDSFPGPAKAICIDFFTDNKDLPASDFLVGRDGVLIKVPFCLSSKEGVLKNVFELRFRCVSSDLMFLKIFLKVAGVFSRTRGAFSLDFTSIRITCQFQILQGSIFRSRY